MRPNLEGQMEAPVVGVIRVAGTVTCSSRACHVLVTFLPRSCHVLATFLSRSCRVLVTFSSRSRHVLVTFVYSFRSYVCFLSVRFCVNGRVTPCHVVDVDVQTVPAVFDSPDSRSSTHLVDLFDCSPRDYKSAPIGLTGLRFTRGGLFGSDTGA